MTPKELERKLSVLFAVWAELDNLKQMATDGVPGSTARLNLRLHELDRKIIEGLEFFLKREKQWANYVQWIHDATASAELVAALHGMGASEADITKGKQLRTELGIEEEHG